MPDTVLVSIVFKGKEWELREHQVTLRSGQPLPALYPSSILPLLPSSQRHTEEGYAEIQDLAIVIAQAVCRSGWREEVVTPEEATYHTVEYLIRARWLRPDQEEELSALILDQLRELSSRGLL